MASFLDEDFDPWSTVEDMDGLDHYRALGLKQTATQEEVRAAYRDMARKHHPDKGGDPAKFDAVRKAYETLGDEEARETYDTWMKELKFRLIPGITPRAAGGEDIILDEFERKGIKCDPMCQLVLVCEVCGRPSNKECYVCTARFCDFCERKRHWKGRFGLHWPVVNVPCVRDEVAKKQLEAKRVEDAKRLALEDPNFRDEWQLKEIRAFKEAGAEQAARSNAKTHYDLRVAKLYMWAQTSSYVYLAVFVPTGYQDRQLHVEISPAGLLVQPEDSPPVIDRAFAYGIATDRPTDSFKSKDNDHVTFGFPKAIPGEKWDCLFRGDSSGARCMEQPYVLKEQEEDVLMEFELPFWIDHDDVRVNITADGVSVDVRNQLSVVRSFWKDREALSNEKKKKDYMGAIMVNDSAWVLEEDFDANGEPCKTLMITFILPPLTEDEITYKKGKRQNNKHERRILEPGDKKGVAFFLDDEDHFRLSDVLQAMCFLETGETFVPAPLAEKYHFPFKSDKRATCFEDLSEDAQKILTMMLEQDEGDEEYYNMNG